MKKGKLILLSSVIQLLSIPLFYWIGYGIGRVFHEPYQKMENHLDFSFDFYGLTLFFLACFLIITVPIVTALQELVIKNEIVMSLIHISWFIFIVWFTIGDLYYRPYEHGLLLACISSNIPARILIRRKLHAYN